MTSSSYDFTIFEDKLFWANFAMKLTTYQTFNKDALDNSQSKSLTSNFYDIFGPDMCTQITSARYRTQIHSLEPNITVQTGRTASTRNCIINREARIPQSYCLRPAVVMLVHEVKQLNSDRIPEATLRDTYDIICVSFADLICDCQYNLILFGEDFIRQVDNQRKKKL